jgi:hypothetical protein
MDFFKSRGIINQNLLVEVKLKEIPFAGGLADQKDQLGRWHGFISATNN